MKTPVELRGCFFSVQWKMIEYKRKKQQTEITRQHEKLGFAGRFGAGLPRVNDGALLFLQHMISKFEDVDEKKKNHKKPLRRQMRTASGADWSSKDIPGPLIQVSLNLLVPCESL